MKGSKKNKDGGTHTDHGKDKPFESEVLVRGAIQVHASTDLIEQHITDRKEDKGQAEKEYRVSKRTFWAVFVYAVFTLALVILSLVNNKIAKDAMRQSQRPWIGPYRQMPILTGPIIIDKDGIREDYRMTAVNFGSYGANNVNFWAQLYITQDISTINQRSKDACVISTQDPDRGRVLFPGQDSEMLDWWPAIARDIITNKNAKPPQNEYQAYLLTCIGYRDQFGIPHHTETIYNGYHPDSEEKILFELTPNQSIPVQWRDWYSHLD